MDKVTMHLKHLRALVTQEGRGDVIEQCAKVCDARAAYWQKQADRHARKDGRRSDCQERDLERKRHYEIAAAAIRALATQSPDLPAVTKDGVECHGSSVKSAAVAGTSNVPLPAAVIAELESDLSVDTETLNKVYRAVKDAVSKADLPAGDGQLKPIDMVLYCPACGAQHIDRAHGNWENPPHRSHLCHGCGCIWRPADIATNGVPSIATKGSADTWAGAPAAGDGDAAWYREGLQLIANHMTADGTDLDRLESACGTAHLYLTTANATPKLEGGDLACHVESNLTGCLHPEEHEGRCGYSKAALSAYPERQIEGEE